jgi:hypothetical protein
MITKDDLCKFDDGEFKDLYLRLNSSFFELDV